MIDDVRQQPAPSEVVTEACCELHPPRRCPPTPCPRCGERGRPVGRVTLGALLKREQRSRIPPGGSFCVCRSPGCDVVYFRPGEALFRKDDLAVRMGLKEPDDPTVPVCYCFGWTPEGIRREIEETGKSTAVRQIKAEVKAGNCRCDIANPEGGCCLRNVSEAVKKAQAQRKGGA